VGFAVSSDTTLGSVIRAEWIKFRSVRSSLWCVAITFILTVGLGILVTTVVRVQWHKMSAINKLTFDPVQTSLVGIVFAQFAVGVIGSLFITSEYSTGSIRTTLAAVPNRIQLIAGKLIVLVSCMLVVGEVVSFGAFFIGQSIYSGVVPTASLSNGAVLRTVIFAGLYLTLLAAFSFALGILIRHSLAAISIFVSILLILPLIIAFLPQSWQNDTIRFLPGEGLGHAMTSVQPGANLFSPWASFGILALYVVVLLTAATSSFRRRDA
jgi:ABC-type transport system involved in multi-copper enzyme maturation permease subunit